MEKSLKSFSLILITFLLLLIWGGVSAFADHEAQPLGNTKKKGAQEIYNNYSHYTPQEVFELVWKAAKFTERVGEKKAIQEFNYFKTWNPGPNGFHIQMFSCKRDRFLAAPYAHQILKIKNLLTGYRDVNGVQIGIQACANLSDNDDSVVRQHQYWLGSKEPVRNFIFNTKVKNTDLIVQVNWPVEKKYTTEKIMAKVSAWKIAFNKKWTLHQKGLLE